MADSEREWRIHEREYTPLTDDELVAILDDTGHDCPTNMSYTPAMVYSMARALRANRQVLEAVAQPGSHATAEMRAKLYRELSVRRGGKPEGTRESLAQCVTMLDTWAPECFPAAENGQIDFGRALMESVADEIREYLSDGTNKRAGGPARMVEVHSRPECTFNYCPNKGGCPEKCESPLQK